MPVCMDSVYCSRNTSDGSVSCFSNIFLSVVSEEKLCNSLRVGNALRRTQVLFDIFCEVCLNYFLVHSNYFFIYVLSCENYFFYSEL
jgi:hypothetical protein